MKKIFNLMLVLALACVTQFPLSAGETAYGYLFGDGSGKKGFVSFDVNSPQNLTVLKNTQYDEIHVSAGECVDGKLYTYRVYVDDMYSTATSYDWTVYDAATFSIESSVNMETSNRVIDMAFDYTTNTMYALVEDKYLSGSVGQASLCAVDMKTGKYTLVGNPGELTAVDGYGRPTDDQLLTLACDANGALYAMSHFRTLYKLDKHTGLASVAAPQHNLSTINQLQSFAFDAEGNLWWAQSHPDYGFFCQIDMETGVPGGFVDFKTDYDKLNKLGENGQLTALFFNDKKINVKSLVSVNSFKTVTKDDDCNSVVLSWEAPTADYSGDKAAVEGYKIFRLGTSDAIATLDADAVTFTDRQAPNGFVTYEIVPFNANGNGFPAFSRVFAGYDMLDAVNDISIKLEDKTATVSWSKPTKTINGGYSNFDEITYNVYRCQGDAEELVAEATTKTSFAETLENAGGYKYIIEPVSGGVVGKRAETKQVLIVTVATIPYFTGFEDSQDGALWTFVNNTTKGWSILSDYTKYDGKCAKAATGGSTALGDDWLISPAISFEKGEYKIDFYACGSSYDKNSVDILLGSSSTDVTTFTIPVLSIVDELVYDADVTPKGWKHFEATFNVDAAGEYHVGFHNKTTATYASFRVDNLSISTKSSGVESVESANNGIKVFVAQNSVTATASQNIQKIEIFDLQGHSVFSRNVNAPECAVSNISLPQGVYLVSAVLADGSHSVIKSIVK